MALAFGIVLVGCASGPEVVPVGADSVLNGTWVSTSDILKFDNGSFETNYNKSPLARGTYTASDGSIRLQVTHYYGGNPQWKGLLQSRWYTKDQLKETFGDTVSDKQLNDLFKPITGKYTISGNVLTMTLKGMKQAKYLKQSGGYMLVNTDTLNVRSGPSADNSIVGTLPRNTRVEVLDRPGQWFKIRSGNIEGYVNSSLLKDE
jgi:uncharacterized protein YgiM (DUF1202 family)